MQPAGTDGYRVSAAGFGGELEDNAIADNLKGFINNSSVSV
jgi:hypothetical protein